MPELMTLRLQGPSLVLTTTNASVFDLGWRNRALLLRLIGAQRLQLVFTDDGDDLLMEWEPAPLPVALPQAPRRPARFRRPAAPVPALSFI